MKQPYKHRVNSREFLNLPGYHDSAYVVAYVEDTSERALQPPEYYPDKAPENFCPRMILEMSDCFNSINLEFDIYSAGSRQNSFHKIDTLIEALQDFRKGMVEECRLYREREALIEKAKEEENKAKQKELEKP